MSGRAEGSQRGSGRCGREGGQRALQPIWPSRLRPPHPHSPRVAHGCRVPPDSAATRSRPLLTVTTLWARLLSALTPGASVCSSLRTGQPRADGALLGGRWSRLPVSLGSAQRFAAGCYGSSWLPVSDFGLREITCLCSRDRRSCHSTAAARLPLACEALNVLLRNFFTLRRSSLSPPLRPPYPVGHA